MTGPLPRPATGPELAVLRHPDRLSAWVVLAAADLAVPVTAADVGGRLSRLAADAPVVAARLRGTTWVPGEPPPVGELGWSPFAAPAPAPAGLVGRFDLAAEPPVRVALADDGRRLVVAAHHAALDGLAVAAVLAALATGQPQRLTLAVRPTDSAGGAPPSGASVGPSGGVTGVVVGAVRRVVRPVDRVPGDRDVPAGETVAARATELPQLAAGSVTAREPELPRPGVGSVTARDMELPLLRAGSVTARLAMAAVGAAGELARRRGAPWRRVGVSVGIGSPAGLVVGNSATYARVDVPALAHPGQVEAAVAAALRRAPPAVEQRHPSAALRLLGPLAGRLSDTVLVSNLGRLELPGVERLAFFPVARGRSAVAVGCATAGDGRAVVTVRARDLGPASVGAFLDDLVARLR